MVYISKKKLKSTNEGRKSLASLSRKFSAKVALSFDFKRMQIEWQDLEITLNNNSASYHHSCKMHVIIECINVYLKRRSELIKDSGLENILSNIDMSVIGTGALVHANDIKQGRHCLPVSLCALLLKLKDVKDKSGSTLSSLE